MFQRRDRLEIRRRDVVVADLTVGDQARDLYRAWVAAPPDVVGAYLFLVGSTLVARGTAQQKLLAQAFIAGWRARGEANIFPEGDET